MTTPRLPLAGRRVLVVEDQFLVADYVQQLLEEAGAIVVGPVASEERALPLIGHGDPLDAAILDVRLGSGTSAKVANALARPLVPFIVVTGYGRDGLPPELRNAPYLTKPIHSSDLVLVATGLFDRAA